MTRKVCKIKISTKLKLLKGRNFERAKKNSVYQKNLKKTPFFAKKMTLYKIFNNLNFNKKNFHSEQSCSLETFKCF